MPQHTNDIAIDVIVQSDLVSEATARAIVLAQRLAGDAPLGLAHIREAARRCGTRIEPVAAAYGWLWDADYDGWAQADEPGDTEYCAPPPLRIDDDETLACLTVFTLSSGRPVVASTSMPPSWAARQRASQIRRDVGHSNAP